MCHGTVGYLSRNLGNFTCVRFLRIGHKESQQTMRWGLSVPTKDGLNVNNSTDERESAMLTLNGEEIKRRWHFTLQSTYT